MDDGAANCVRLTKAAGPLHLAFFSVKSLLLRALMSPATPLSKSNPFSNLRTHFDSALEEFKLFVKLVSSLTAEDLCAFWGRRMLSAPLLKPHNG